MKIFINNKCFNFVTATKFWGPFYTGTQFFNEICAVLKKLLIMILILNL